MTLNVGKEVAAMERMTNKQLRERYAEVFGEPTAANNKAWLVKRVTWRFQANAEGGLSDRARRRAEELANIADLRTTAPPEKPVPVTRVGGAVRVLEVPADDRLPPPGSIITRPYKRDVVQVKVLEVGFEYAGAVHGLQSSCLI